VRILLDECVNPRLRLAFPGAHVKTVTEMGWRSLTNGRLLREAIGQFDVFVTLDRNLSFQNPVEELPIGILVLKTPFNDLATYRPQFAAIRDAAFRTKPGQVTVVRVG
jgi:predicted nuclease of predicted toxin-antitoxin system